MPTTPNKNQNSQNKLLEKRLKIWKSLKDKYNYVFDRSSKQQPIEKTVRFKSPVCTQQISRKFDSITKKQLTKADCQSQKISLQSQQSRDRLATKQLNSKGITAEKLKAPYTSRFQTVDAKCSDSKDFLTARASSILNVPIRIINESDRNSLERVDRLISKCSNYLQNNEAFDILMLQKKCLYDDRKAEVNFETKSGKGQDFNPFLEEKQNDSDVSDSEIDDEYIRFLRQMKIAQETLKKYNDLHDYAFKQLDLYSSTLARKIIESPLKLSLSQIFQGFEDDFLNNDEIKRKFYRRLQRDFHFHPNYENNTNVLIL